MSFCKIILVYCFIYLQQHHLTITTNNEIKMENQDLFSRLEEYATGLERELKEAIETKATWETVSRGMHRSLGAYAGLQTITIQEREGLIDSCKRIEFYGEMLVKLYELFPEVKTVAEFYQEFPNLKLGDENDR